MRSSLRDITIPRFALRRDEAAASLGVSPAKYDTWVAAGKMPKGKKIDGVVCWDVEQVRTAWRDLYDADDRPKQDDGDNPFDAQVV